jgi:threonine synthase
MNSMEYVSTRGSAPALTFGDVLLTGLAPDGGLYLPQSWPQAVASARTDSYVHTAIDIMWPFVAGSIDRDAFEAIVADTYATFETDDVVELIELDPNLWIMELFHGPTLAFKDVALQLVGRLFDYELNKRNERITIVGATSGDTGSAAIEACRDRDAIDIFILHPHGRVSDVQRRQMTTVDAANVHNVAIEGTFDDCQDLVKAMFADTGFRDEVRLGAVNSINWARVMAQIVYYVVASARIASVQTPVSFTVPTGNFGNVFAGWAARSMGLPVDRFCVASNMNDILARLFTTGTMEIREVVPTLSPSMDIQISSNLERLLFETHGRNGTRIAEAMAEFRDVGTLTLDDDHRGLLAELWQGVRVDDEGAGGVVETIKQVHDQSGMQLDPHTAVGVAAARSLGAAGSPMVCLGTAHPAKFPDAVEHASGVRPPLPDRVGDLFARTERFEVLPNDLRTVEDHVRSLRTTG